jgi:Flp pilus assembly protein TadB
MGAWLSDVFAWLIAITAPIPEAVLGLALLALVAVFVIATLRDRRRHEQPATVHDCCDTDPTPTAAPEDTGAPTVTSQEPR